MITAMSQLEDHQRKIQAQRFGLYLGLTTIVMLFTALTSAYIVRQGAGNWLFVKMPMQFWISTGIIILSSGTMYYAKAAHKAMEVSKFRILFWSTFILGTAFIISQYQGWLAIAKTGIYLDGNPGGSFIYVISMVHVVHVMVGLVLLFIMALRTTIKKFNPNYNYKIGFIATYWHFIGIVWIYLFIFFQIKFF